MTNLEKPLQLAYLILGILSFGLLLYLNFRRIQILEEDYKKGKMPVQPPKSE